MNNSLENVHNVVDIHWLYKLEAIQTVADRISETEKALRKQEVTPNVGNDADHIFKIICGKGYHSKEGLAVNKFAVKEWLDEKQYEYHPDFFNGVFLVRLKV